MSLNLLKLLRKFKMEDSREKNVYFTFKARVYLSILRDLNYTLFSLSALLKSPIYMHIHAVIHAKIFIYR